MLKSTDGARTWNATGLTDTEVVALTVDPKNPGTLYAGTYLSGVFKSTDGATTWSAAGLSDICVPVLAVDPTNPGTLYAGTQYGGPALSGGGVFKSADGAGTWNAVSTGLTNPNVRDLAIDPETPNTIYVATAGGESAARTCPLGADLDHTFS